MKKKVFVSISVVLADFARTKSVLMSPNGEGTTKSVTNVYKKSVVPCSEESVWGPTTNIQSLWWCWPFWNDQLWLWGTKTKYPLAAQPSLLTWIRHTRIRAKEKKKAKQKWKFTFNFILTDKINQNFLTNLFLYIFSLQLIGINL